jgi:integrase
VSKAHFPRLRQKGKAFYFDTQEKPRRWIPLGSDPAAAMTKYRRLILREGNIGTVARLLSDYLAHLEAGGRGAFGKPVADSTVQLYRNWARKLGAVFPVAPIEITQGDVARYLHDCVRTSARGEISLLSSAYQHAMARGELQFNPCIGVRSSRPRSKRSRALTDAEFAAVREKASPLLRVAIDLAYMTGLRVSDLIDLRWNQFGDAGVVEHKKTGFRQHFELTEDLGQVLDEARLLQGKIGSIYVLSGRGGKQLNRHTIDAWWRKACAAAGVKGAVWHDLRAKGGTDKDAQGGNAQQFLGHTDPRTTQGYLRGRRVVSVEPLHRKKG